MSHTKKIVTQAIAMAALLSEGMQVYTNEPRGFVYQTPKPKKKIIPKGCFWFHFGEDGGYCVDDIQPAGTFFSCVARNEVNAVRKFKRFIDQK